MTESHILQGPTQNRVTYEKNLQQIYVESKNLRHGHGNMEQKCSPIYGHFDISKEKHPICFGKHNLN